MLNKKIFLTITFTLIIISASAQDMTGFYEQSLHHNKNGMLVLGSWALANIATGAYGWSKFEGPKQYFHQMNLFWNTVNLGIAGFGFYSALNTDISTFTGQEMLDDHLKFERILLINSGLDLLYIGTGAYMSYLSKHRAKRKDMLKGYGHSLMLQGGFLLGFDAVLYLIKRSHRLNADIPEMLTNIYISPSSFGVTWVF